MSAPTTYAPAAAPTCWLDVATAAGVTDEGRVVRPVIGGRRKHPTTVDYLDTARAAGCTRVYLTGARPTPPRWRGARASDWLAEPTPEWTPHERGHYFDADRPVGRFTHDTTGERCQVRRAAEWFGDGDYTPSDAREAWTVLRAMLAHAWRRPVELMDSPSATGQNLWAATLPRDVELPTLDDDVAALVRSTSPQHRVELVDHGDTELPGFVYLDGRLMYAALTRELGSAPVVEIFGPGAETYAAEHPHARARYEVSWRAADVPDDWQHVGLLMCKDDDGVHWRAPRAGKTWCDAAELHTAWRAGWAVTVHRALVFTHYGARACNCPACVSTATQLRPLDVFTERLVKARERGAQLDAGDAVRGLVEDALRAILLYTIGAFHSVGRNVTRITDAPMRDRHPDERIEELPNGLYKLTRRVALGGRAALFRHPEWSSQVWGRAHARILTGPGPGCHTGALHVPADALIGIRGDALYLTAHPGWPDDGRVGRLRVKGTIDHPVPAPRTLAQLDALRAQSTERKQP